MSDRSGGRTPADLRPLTFTRDYTEMAAAYGVAPGTNGSLPTDVRNTTMQIMGAELTEATIRVWRRSGDSWRTRSWLRSGA